MTFKFDGITICFHNDNLPTKGHLFWKKKWYSVCSVHYEFNESCVACHTGRWINVLAVYINNLIYFISPKIWQKVSNRKKKSNIFEYYEKNK